MQGSDTPDTRARMLRRNMTDAERFLWSALRMRRIANRRFRRQHSIGNYIVDFCCVEARLIVELDGSQHADEVHAWYDKHRSDWLATQGYKVIRFWNGDVLKRRDDVIDAIRQTLSGR